MNTTQPGLISHKIQRFGWKPDLPDFRDHMYSAPHMTLAALPPKVELRPQCPSVYDQGDSAAAPATQLPEPYNSTVRSRSCRRTSSRPVCSSTTTSG